MKVGWYRLQHKSRGDMWGGSRGTPWSEWISGLPRRLVLSVHLRPGDACVPPHPDSVPTPRQRRGQQWTLSRETFSSTCLLISEASLPNVVQN